MFYLYSNHRVSGDPLNSVGPLQISLIKLIGRWNVFLEMIVLGIACLTAIVEDCNY